MLEKFFELGSFEAHRMASSVALVILSAAVWARASLPVFWEMWLFLRFVSRVISVATISVMRLVPGAWRCPGRGG